MSQFVAKTFTVAPIVSSESNAEKTGGAAVPGGQGDSGLVKKNISLSAPGDSGHDRASSSSSSSVSLSFQPKLLGASAHKKPAAGEPSRQTMPEHARSSSSHHSPQPLSKLSNIASDTENDRVANIPQAQTRLGPSQQQQQGSHLESAPTIPRADSIQVHSRGRSSNSYHLTSSSGLQIRPTSSSSSSTRIGLLTPSPERALVSGPGSHAIISSSFGANSGGADPFMEITRTVHAQSRRIKELEAANRDSEDAVSQLRQRMSDLQEQIKVSANDASVARGEIARMETMVKHKDEEVSHIQQRVHSLEAERARMVSENLILMRSMDEQKRRFASDLKQATQSILILSKVIEKPQNWLMPPVVSVTETEQNKALGEDEASKGSNLSVDDPKQVSAEQGVEPSPPPNHGPDQVSKPENDNKEYEMEIKSLGHRCMVLQREYEISVYWVNVFLDLFAECHSCATKYEALRPELEAKQPHHIEEGDTMNEATQQSSSLESQQPIVVLEVQDIPTDASEQKKED